MNSNVAMKAKISVSHWILLIGLYFVFFFFPFRRALFNGSGFSFEPPIIFSQILTWILLLVAGISLCYTAKSHERWSLALWAIPLIPLVYLISRISPASAYFSSATFWIYAQYAAFLLIGFVLSRNLRSSGLLGMALIASGWLIVIFGFMNWFGDASFWGMFQWDQPGKPTLYQDAVMHTADGYRLTSVFQYANSYAAYLIGLLLASITVAIYTRNKALMFISGTLLVPVLLSFILTLSRGGLIVFPLVAILFLPALIFRKQLAALLLLFVSGAATVILLQPIINLGSALQESFVGMEAAKGWGLLISSSLIVGAFVLLLRLYLEPKFIARLERTDARAMFRFLVPILGVVIGALSVYFLFVNSNFTKLLPEQIEQRIANINFNQNSVLERGTFYQDALALWKDYPLTGAGGGAWQTLYEKYQNNPYTSRQAHNFFLQTLVEVGLLGLSVIVLWFGFVFYFFLRSLSGLTEQEQWRSLVFYSFIIAILIHSIIDFNMSFVYLGLVVFLSTGGLLTYSRLPQRSFAQRLTEGKRAFAFPTMVVLLSVISFIFSTIRLSASDDFSNARTLAFQGGAADEIFSKLNVGIARTGHPEFVDFKLQVLLSVYQQSQDPNFANEFNETLIKYKNTEPYYKAFVHREVQFLSLQNKYNEAAELLEASIPNYPWDIVLYEQLASMYFKIGLSSLETGQTNTAIAAWDKVTSLLARVNEKVAYLDTLPEAQIQGRAFGLTPNLALPLGQIAFFRGDYTAAEQYLAMRLDPNYDDPYDSEAALYYAAAQSKQGKGDGGLVEAMLSNYPEQQEQLAAKFEALVAQAVINP